MEKNIQDLRMLELAKDLRMYTIQVSRQAVVYKSILECSKIIDFSLEQIRGQTT